MKKNILILFFCFLLFLSSFPCYGLDKKRNNSYVVDDALILKNDTKDYIELYSNYIKKALKIDYYLITFTALEENNIKDYTDYIFDTFNISNRGILIVVSKEDREVRVKVGSLLADVITDEIITSYLNLYFVPYLANGEWDKGIKNGYSAFYKLICDSYSINSDTMKVIDGNNVVNKYKYYIIIAIVWIITFLAYSISEYLKKILSNKKIKNKDRIILCFCIMLNIILLFVAYLLLPLSLIIILLFEFVTIVSESDLLKIRLKKNKKRILRR